MFSSSLKIRVSARLKFAKPEKSQRYVLHSRINCTAVFTSVLFEETKLRTNTSSLQYSLSKKKKTTTTVFFDEL